jgi:hypothetical protein
VAVGHAEDPPCPGTPGTPVRRPRTHALLQAENPLPSCGNPHLGVTVMTVDVCRQASTEPGEVDYEEREPSTQEA